MERQRTKKAKKVETDHHYELLIDYDYKFPILKCIQKWMFKRKFIQTAKFLTDECYIHFDAIFVIPSTHGLHIYAYIITSFQLDKSHLLFLQTILGDDRNRCIYNFNRMLLGWKWKYSNVLFQQNEKGKGKTWFI